MADENDNTDSDGSARTSKVASILSYIPGVLLGLVLFHFSFVSKEGRDLYIAYGITLLMMACFCGLCLKIIQNTPGLSSLWSSMTRSIGGKKKKAAFERWAWGNVFLGLGLVALLHFLRSLGS